ncbi:ATP-binding protein [Leifsonia soli]|uniref:Uncharacterized protein YPO0396 n=1 Tax=Leifsonia soli TaxID=582665 RepID=A0A852T412_9MICO|nr:SbcC/MukB-like Walker B domain-containing protein [Leifsonia soli]NYD75260.1 uncharacterized protein YPO0396 [Leifsonia soli]
MTFISEAGERFTAMRAYYVPIRASRSAEISMRMITINDAFDLRDLKEFARIGDNHFPPRELKAVWPEMRTYDSYSSFAQALFVKLGIGAGGDGAKALRLLARIQASEDIPTVDRLYKELVIEKPDSYDKADAAIEHFDRLEDVYQEMLTAQARADLLGPITSAHEALDRAQKAIETDDELGSLDAETTPAGLWRLHRHSGILSRSVDANRTATRGARTEWATLIEREQALKSRLEAAKKAHNDQGGGLLSELGIQIAGAEGRMHSREERRARLVTATTILNTRLATQAEFEQVQEDARGFMAAYPDEHQRLSAERDEVLSRRWPVQNRLKEIRAELESLQTRAGRIDHYLHDMRQAAAEASGLAISDLPFVAELIDVMPDEEYWRTAIETALYSGARRMLVPLEHLEHFSRAIDPLHLKGRLHFEGVPRSQGQRQPIFEPDHIAGKLLFKESPYQSWVTEYVSHPSRDALCVAGPDQLNGEDLRITAAGQTRRGRGGSHGRQSGRNVIGFDNADLREELTQEKESLKAQLESTDDEANQIAKAISILGAKKDAHALIANESWPDLDVASAVAERDDLVRRRDEIRNNNDVLAALDLEIETLDDELEDVQRERHDRETVIKGLESEHSGLVEAEDRINPVLERIENEGVLVLRDELAEDLNNLWAQVLLDEAETPESFSRNLNRLRAELQKRATEAREEVTRLTQQIEATFKRYLTQWDDSNLGTTIDFYDDYAGILEEILRSGLHERRDEWRRRLLVWSGQHLQQLATALTAAIEEIEDRLDPINQILRDLPFGPTNDRLFIDLRRLQPDAVVKFRKELAQHARMATTGLDNDQLEQAFKELRRFMAQLRRKDDIRLPRELVEVVDRDRLLDVRRHVEITAQRRNLDGEPLSIYRSLQGKSGGEMQELIAFIVGSALRFQLGDQQRERPRFAPVFLDEGFIKADGQFTSRAVQAWRGLGFQLIIGAPVDKAPALEPHADVIVEIAKNLSTHRSYVLEIRGVDQNSNA